MGVSGSCDVEHCKCLRLRGYTDPRKRWSERRWLALRSHCAAVSSLCVKAACLAQPCRCETSLDRSSQHPGSVTQPCECYGSEAFVPEYPKRSRSSRDCWRGWRPCKTCVNAEENARRGTHVYEDLIVYKILNINLYYNHSLTCMVYEPNI